MAEQDFCLKQLLRDKHRFADLFNGSLFDGKQILNANELELIPDESGILFIDKDGIKRTMQRRRDVVMKSTSNVCFAIFAWEGSKSLCELLGLSGSSEATQALTSYIPNYRLNLVNARNIADINKFQTSLQYIFGMLKYNSDKALLYAYAQAHREEINQMDDDSMMAVFSLLGEQKRLMKIVDQKKTAEGGFDMCVAIDELIADGEIRGEARGEEKTADRAQTLVSCFFQLASAKFLI